MKVLIWIGCMFVPAFIIALLATSAKTQLGALPTMLLYAPMFFLAKSLCKKYDEKYGERNREKKEEKARARREKREAAAKARAEKKMAKQNVSAATRANIATGYSPDYRINNGLSEINDESTAILFCHKCGQRLQPNSRFCPSCGALMSGKDNAERNTDRIENEEQFETLYEDSPFTIQDNIPVMIEHVLLRSDHENEILIANSIFRSLTDIPIIAMLIDVHCKDIWGNDTAPVEGFQYLDLKTQRESAFGQNVQIQIPDLATRSIEIEIKRILYADHSIVEAASSASRLKPQITLEQFFEDKELVNEYIRETNPKARYAVVTGEHYWRCACGAINHNENDTCYRCNADRNQLVDKMDIDLISKNLTAVKEEERIKAEKEKAEKEERLRQEQERIRKAREEQERLDRERAERIAEARRLEQERKRRNTKRALIVVVAILGTAFLVYAIGWHVVPYVRYTKAERLLEEKAFDEAYTGFDSLNGFSDSKNRAVDTLYQKGVYLLNSGAYLEAASVFDRTSSYQDSAEKAAYCRNEAAYLDAKALFERKEYQSAADVFTALEDYSDSADWALESTYCYAQMLLENEEFEDAHSVFLTIPDYKESKTQANECYYQYATKLFNEKKYEDAHTYFSKVSSYKDSKTQANESYYLLAKDYFDKEDYEKAQEYYAKVSSYKDSKDQANESYYLLGNQLYAEKKYDEAYKTYKKITSYKDSKDLANEAEYLYAVECFDAGKYEQAVSAFKNVSSYKDVKDRLPEAKYQYALQLTSKSKWKEASTLFKELDKYKDSQKQYKETYYQYGLQLLKEKSYTGAVTVFESLGNYQESKTKLNEARYAYVKAHKNNTDTTTYKYLTELKKARYQDSDKIYSSLYAWKITNTYWNTSADSTSKMTSISRSKPVYCHFELSGGPPGGKIYISRQVVYPDGSKTARRKTSEQWERGSSGWVGWASGIYSNPSSGATGTLKFLFYDESNNLIGETSVKITY